MNEFLTSNETRFRLLRTIVQGVIGVIIANLDTIIGLTPIPIAVKPIIVALVMACLSPIMAELGKHTDPVYEEAFDDFEEDEGGDGDDY